MASQYVKAQGVTGPLSTAVPTALELAANDDLVTELKRQNNYENPEETAKRYVRLTTVQDQASLEYLGTLYSLTNYPIKSDPPFFIPFNRSPRSLLGKSPEPRESPKQSRKPQEERSRLLEALSSVS